MNGSESQRDGPNEAQGEPRFAAKPQVHVWARIGRAQDVDTHRRSPSPQQPADCRALQAIDAELRDTEFGKSVPQRVARNEKCPPLDSNQ